MSFFGLEQNDLESEKHKFGQGGLHESEDVAVYTWGEESYDGLGDALQEGGDELNDETFGGDGKVGKDFDFSNQALPDADLPPKPHRNGDEQQVFHRQAESQQSQQPRDVPGSLEALWNDNSAFSALPRANGAGRAAIDRRHTPTQGSPYQQHDRVLTVAEVEAGMRQRHAQEQQHLEQQEFLRQQQLQQQQDLYRLQQAQQHQHQRTPPPRMLPHTQSPRFHQQHQQILLLQQQQELQEQQRLKQLQEQLRHEELERQLRAQQVAQLQQSHHPRQPSGPTIADIQAAQILQQQRRQSPAFGDAPLQGTPYLPQNIQLQQRLLSEMAQAEFIREMQGATQQEQEILRMEAMRKIMEAERMEEKRRRKANKIAHMSRYNDLMTQSDKDFITRIQVSQLVTQDPYAEDFYAQVYGAIARSRLGLQSQDERVLKFGSGGGVGLGLAQKGPHRRPNAMQRMEAQVERIVSNARIREKEKGMHSLHSLQGALGKTSGRSYKAAPRQLLQVEPGNADASPTLSHAHAHISKEDGVHNDKHGAAKEAAKLGREALGTAADTDGLVRKEPLSNRQVLVILENLYDIVMRVEQLRRDQPSPDEQEAFQEWEKTYNDLVAQLWVELRVMVPLETSNPHPFISLLGPTKGKKLLPRLTRHLNEEQLLTMLTLLVACFTQLDVIKQAPYLDSLEDTPERREAERQTHTFLGSVTQTIMTVSIGAHLRIIAGMLGLLLDRCDIVAVAQARPGMALLTIWLSRVEMIKEAMSKNTLEGADIPSAEEAQQWQLMFDHMFNTLAPHFLVLFPSTRLASVLPPNLGPNKPTDVVDQPVWSFLAALALQASPEQQQVLVTALREKVLENVLSVNKGWTADEKERQMKLTNVNLFLNALGLDSSQITT
ncbi:hypothetical protein PLICRDRAFT_176983 [Plicaturopsis crispa FD-325 SS-3]|nr:hypothetical protein PLICRDRAFT_176983 [Plicaturopsis crispa FD-325 SS-3]